MYVDHCASTGGGGGGVEKNKGRGQKLTSVGGGDECKNKGGQK